MQRKKRKPNGRLMLTRQEGQSIQIGENVTVTIEAIKGSKVSVSIVAPVEVRVMRDDAIKLQPPGSSDTMETGE